MSKPTKAAEAPKTEAAKSVEALVQIADVVFENRGNEKPTFAEVARLANKASGLLRIKDRDEKLSIENAATIQIAKKYNLVS